MLGAEVREADADHLVLLAQQRELALNFAGGGAVAVLQVPLAGLALGLAPAETDGTVGRHDVARALVDQQRLPVRVVVFAQAALQMAGTQEVFRQIAASLLLQTHQHGHVGQAADVVGEIAALLVEVEFLEDHMAHGHGERSISALLGRQPDVAELGHLAEVAGHGHGLGALVAHLGVEVGIGRARHRHVGAPHHQVGGVVPVGRFGHVGLLAPDLRAGRRQVAVPVVKGQRHATNQAQVAAAGRVADHGHGRNRRETEHAVRAVVLDGVGVGGCHHLVHFVPAGAHKAALATTGLVFLGLFRVLADAFPGIDGAHALARLTPHLHQLAAHHGVLHALCRVHVPAVGRPTRAAARLMVGQVGPGAGVVGLLGFPGDQAVLHVHLPAAGAGAVHAVRAAHDLVVLPALAICVFPLAVFFHHRAVAVREGGFHLAHEFQSVEKMAHGASVCARCGTAPPAWSMDTSLEIRGVLPYSPVGRSQAADGGPGLRLSGERPMPFTTVLLPAGLPCQGQDPASPPLLPATVALQHGTSAFLRA